MLFVNSPFANVTEKTILHVQKNKTLKKIVINNEQFLSHANCRVSKEHNKGKKEKVEPCLENFLMEPQRWPHRLNRSSEAAGSLIERNTIICTIYSTIGAIQLPFAERCFMEGQLDFCTDV